MSRQSRNFCGLRYRMKEKGLAVLIFRSELTALARLSLRLEACAHHLPSTLAQRPGSPSVPGQKAAGAICLPTSAGTSALPYLSLELGKTPQSSSLCQHPDGKRQEVPERHQADSPSVTRGPAWHRSTVPSALQEPLPRLHPSVLA